MRTRSFPPFATPFVAKRSGRRRPSRPTSAAGSRPAQRLRVGRLERRELMLDTTRCWPPPLVRAAARPITWCHRHRAAIHPRHRAPDPAAAEAGATWTW